MTILKKASYQLFSRPDDEQFKDFDSLYQHCLLVRDESDLHWKAPSELIPISMSGRLGLKLTGNSGYYFNEWSFGQVCTSAGIKKETLNRLKTETAVQVLLETMPQGGKPVQVVTFNGQIRALHGISYTRLFDSDVLKIAMEEALDFRPPPVGSNGATGLYSGQQDMFAFLIDDKSWVDIDGQNFAPGFFIYNSEVGKRAVGIDTFWFQQVCGSHIIWDAMEVASYKRKHSTNVASALDDMRSILAGLVKRRDERKDAFAKGIALAMRTSLGSSKIEVAEALIKQGIAFSQIKAAMALMTKTNNVYSLFNAVDALTQINGGIPNAGDRLVRDKKVGSLLSLVN